MFEATEEYLELLTTALSKKTGVKIRAGEHWLVNLPQKRLEYVAKDLTKLPFMVTKGILLHEIGHLKYTKAYPASSLEKKYPSYHSTYNNLEDLRIENKLTEEYGDFASQALGRQDDFCIGNSLTRSDKSKQLLPKLLQFNSILLFAGLLQSLNPDWVTKDRIREALSQYRTEFLPEVLGRFHQNQYQIETALERITEADTTAEVKAISDEVIFPIIEDYLKEYPKPIEKGCPQSGQMGQLLSKATKKQVKRASQGHSRHDYLPYTVKEVEEVINPYITTLSQRLKDILKEKRQVRFRGQYRKGKLLNQSAYKVAIGEEKIFSKRTTPDTPEYVFHLVLDQSGSMAEDLKADYTFFSACLIQRIAENLGFQTKIYLFDESIVVVKNLDEYKNINGGGTSDKQALKFLKKQVKPENDDLIFFFTDGISCGDPKEEIREITKKNASLLGIGFGSKSRDLIERYPEAIVVDRPQELFMQVIEKLRGIIQR